MKLSLISFAGSETFPWFYSNVNTKNKYKKNTNLFKNTQQKINTKKILICLKILISPICFSCWNTNYRQIKSTQLS